MTRSEARTPDAWRGFDRAALYVTLAGILALLLMWWSGYGPSQAGCCAAPVVAAPVVATPITPAAPVVAPAPAPVAASEPAKVEPEKVAAPPIVAAVAPPAPAKAEPPAAAAARDCAKIVEGVAVRFDFGSATLSTEASVALDRALLCVGGGRYEVVGHADSVGDKALNQRLSEARADAVVAYLRSKGVDAARLAARGYGETKPIADNNTEEGRAQNRRVTITRLP